MNNKVQIPKNSLNTTVFSKWSFEPICIFDENMICLDVNEAATRVFQYNRKELIGHKLYFLVAEKDLPWLLENVKTSHSSPYQVELIRKDGSKFIGLLQGRSITQDGQRLRITTCRDISEIVDIQNKLESNNNKLESIFNNNLSGIVVLNEQRFIQQANQVAADIVGYDHPDELIGKDMLDLHISKEVYDEFSHFYLSSLLNREKSTKEIQLARKDGSRIWVRVSGSLISAEEPPKLDEGIAWVIDDISEIKEAESKMVAAYNELEVIFNNALVGIMVVGKDGIIQRVNQTFVDMLGFNTPNDWVGKPSREVHLSDESYLQFNQKFHPALINKENVDIDYQVKSRNGSPIWVSISGKALDTNLPADLEKGVVWVTRDINKRKLMEEQLIKLTREDALTGLFNRRYFIESSDREVELMHRYDKSLSLLTIDIDHFKSINDTFGHDIGDQALVFFSKICTDIVRSIDIVGRMGGEEFAILLIESTRQQASDIAHRILNTLTKQSMLHQDIPSMSASIGVVQIEPKETLQSAMKRADKLLYTAKKNGRSRVFCE